MDPVPKARQTYPDEDPKEVDENIPEEVRIKQKRLENEKAEKAGVKKQEK